MKNRSLEELKKLHIAKIGYLDKTIRVYLPKEPTAQSVIEVEVDEPTRFEPPQTKHTVTFTPTSKNQNDWLGEAFNKILEQLPPIYSSESVSVSK
jgi:hypothetical protein